MRFVVAGGTGYIGSACADCFADHGMTVRAFSLRGGTTPSGRAVVAIDDDSDMRDLFSTVRPDAVVIATGVPDPDTCECDPDLSEKINVRLVSTLVEAIQDTCPAALIVLMSSIYVFGEHCPAEGFCETDKPAPLSVYGRHKLQAERILQHSGLRHLIVRLPWVIGNTAHASDPVRELIGKVLQGEMAVDDGIRFPTDALWVAECLLELIRRRVEGVIHLSSSEPVSRYALLSYLFTRSGQLSAVGLHPKRTTASVAGGGRAFRPEFIRLRSVRSDECSGLMQCPPWQRVAERYAESCGLRTATAKT